MSQFRYTFFVLLFIIVSCSEPKRSPTITGTWRNTYHDNSVALDVNTTLNLRRDRYFILEREFYPEVYINGKREKMHVIFKEQGPYRRSDTELLLQIKDKKTIGQNQISRRYLSDNPYYNFGLDFSQSELYHLRIDSVNSNNMMLTDMTEQKDSFNFIR